MAKATTVLARCSFCLKPSSRVRRLVAGPGVFICDACAALCVELVEGDAAPGAGVAPWDLEVPLDQVLAHLGLVEQARVQVDENLAAWVHKARRLGATWAQVGEALSITRQSAWERFAAGP